VTEHSPPGADELRDKDSTYVLRPWSGEPPVIVVSAQGCTVTDASGAEYLDFTAGYFVNQAGHCHPRIVEAATRQLGQVMQVSGKQATPASIALAERLVQITPRPLAKSFFATGGSEATEFALRMARQHTGKEDVAYLENAYHGLTLGALEVCASDKYRASGGVALAERTYRLPTPYCYRCEYQGDCATQCLDEAEARLDQRPATAAIIAEPIQSVGGVIPPEKWWARADQIRKKRGLLLILDEIQTGLGRTGTMFAAEHYGLEPDILTAGKGLSGGVGALSVAMATDEVAAGFFGGTTPTNGGNAVSAAAGLALIDVLTDEGLIANCAAMGEHFTRAVADLDDPWVGDIRFKGLLGGVELVASRASKEILPKHLITAIHDTLHRDGMLLTVSGMHGNVLRLQPPLSITAQQIDTFVTSLRNALELVRKQSGQGDRRYPAR
jgi:4-aminobutyrate aminotransferase / (S)-3-amino-2-methylpropionate transaminase / 5-aminovalerate transaminase